MGVLKSLVRSRSEINKSHFVTMRIPARNEFFNMCLNGFGRLNIEV